MALAACSEAELVCLSLHEDGICNVMDALIWGNSSLYVSWPSPNPDFGRMNNAQRALATLDTLYGQVMNGGLSQHLFNCPNEVEMLVEALPSIEWPEFERAVKSAFDGLDVALVNKLVEAAKRGTPFPSSRTDGPRSARGPTRSMTQRSTSGCMRMMRSSTAASCRWYGAYALI